MLPLVRNLQLTCAAALVIGLTTRYAVVAAEPLSVAYLWQSQPTLPFKWQTQAPIANVFVTAELINSPLVKDRIFATQAILRVPNSPALDREKLLPVLLERLRRGEPDALVRTELIAAACAWDNGTHAAELWKWAQGDRLAEGVVERACTQWRSKEPLTQWRARMQSNAASENELLQAIDGLAATGSVDDLTILKSIASDGARSAPMRLASARAIGELSQVNELELAKQLRESSSIDADVLAVSVLSGSPVADVTEFVQDIALKGKSIAQRTAYAWLSKRDATSAQRIVQPFLTHSDAAVRALAREQILLADNDQTLPALFAAFDDVHPGNRDQARELVLTCSGRSETHLASVKEQLQLQLQSDDWRRLEQSIRLAVELGLKEHFDRCLALLTHPRPEVAISAGWALRNLVSDEANLEKMLVFCKQLTERLAANELGHSITEPNLRAAAHLFEAFGQHKYQPAKTVLIQYVPKNPSMGLITRMAAIWSCGRLWEHDKNEALTNELHARIADKTSMFPESPSVRYTCTLASGYIADPVSREPLIKFDEAGINPIGCATVWALDRIEKHGKQ